MNRRRFLGGLGAASASLLAPVAYGRAGLEKGIAPPASGDRNSRMTKLPENSSVVMVHGAWADGSCWSSVIAPLERRGLDVICAPIPMTSLTNDATVLQWALDRTSGPVVLVGHAYSGAVIGAVQDERVKALVYVTALAPDEGETVAKVFYLNPSSPEAPKMVPDSHGFVWMPADGFRRALAQNASIEQLRIAAAVQRPLGVQCIQQPAPSPAWKTRPSWFLLAEEDRMINPKTQRFMADRMRATVHRAPVDHTPMYSAPHVVVDVILDAAQKSL
ncbi:MAG TPA: alpha/beta hydrolase [Acidobacteriaceae bacterium]|nr:alpha/beta hydrolase [Acidobacteriaceae bacterium]